ncbi:MAG: cobalt transporter CbiM [Deltaproteobacteria bacterium]|jgi:cobalt/nickel transport system permease protein|nr:cobalt transporter CbiM [Deltaproteobacteria bacterium]
MHISEGVLSLPVLLTGAALTVGGLYQGLKAIDQEDMPKAAILSAVFFTASLIHVNIGPSSTHLVLSGLIGLIMGWAAFPVIFLGLLLQGILFNFGGLTTLGLNTFNMAAPAVLVSCFFNRLVNGQNPVVASISGFLTGSLPILLSAFLVGVSLTISGEHFLTIAWAVFLSNLPIVFIEGLVCMFCVQFLRKVRPAILRPQIA